MKNDSEPLLPEIVDTFMLLYKKNCTPSDPILHLFDITHTCTQFSKLQSCDKILLPLARFSGISFKKTLIKM